MEFVVKAGLIFSEALCHASTSNRVFLTDYNQTLSDHVLRMKEDLIADNYFEKTWTERLEYYHLKTDEIVGKLADEQLLISEVAELSPA